MPRTRPKVHAPVVAAFVAPVAQPVAPSLPPVPAEGALLASTERSYAPPTHALIKKRALAIVAMRHMGYARDQIAKELGVLPATLDTIMWRAGKYGFLQDLKSGSLLDDPTERITYELSHKAVRNFDEMLDSDQILERGQKSVKMEATFELAKGSLFKKFDQPKESGAQTMNALKIEIVMPTSGMQEARAGAMGGCPTYTEGKIEGEDS